METILEQPVIKKISLPNKKYGKRINLEKFFCNIQDIESFKPQYDKDSNPYQNWVEVTITGKAKFFSNGTITTNLNLPDSALIEFFDKFYKAYIIEVLE